MAQYRFVINYSIALCDPAYDGGVGLFESCQADEDPTIVYADPPTGPVRTFQPAGGGAARTTGPAGRSWRVFVPAICMSEPGVAVLDRIEPRTLGALQIERAGVLPGSTELAMGVGVDPLPGEYLPLEGYRLSGGCLRTAGIVEPGLQVSRTGPGDAALRGFDLVYHVGNRTFRYFLAETVTLCDPDPATTRRLYGC